jgi:para-aminobenzoate synthetase
MRTLLVDNYDSYTYNLFQLLAEVNGREPVVVRNDERALEDLDLAAFDNVVISPGPGHPRSRRDFGVSREALLHSGLPVLGVCLGHQGIGYLAGAAVGPAPVPRHGHLTRVRHDGTGLFAGLPQGFIAVRYHSLCIQPPLPSCLAATAWAEDGVIMGVAHRSRPWWGVQFHPESVATEYGRPLVENFAELTRRHRGTARRRPPAPATRPAARRTRPLTLRLEWARLDHAVDTEAAFVELYGDSEHAFWLDSSRLAPGLSRFSFLGDASGPLSEVLAYRVGTGAVDVRLPAGCGRQRLGGSIFDVLEDRLARFRVAGDSLPFDFTCGYVGFFGYELKADCGSPNRHAAETPDAVWVLADRLVCVDHQRDRTYVVAAYDPEGGGRGEAQAWVERTADRLVSLPAGVPPAGRGGPAAALDVAALLVRDRQRYLADIEQCQRQLRAGESYEICLTNRLRTQVRTPGLDFYRHLRRGNPAPYAAFLRLGRLCVASSSPERFLKVDRGRRVETRPIKGTAPRGRDPLEDDQLRVALATSPKTQAENLMIVDLLRNDLGRVCEVGSIRVKRFMAVETYATMHQLVSTVAGRLAPHVGAVGCVRACFPGGSMTGAPKLRTLEILDGLETEARGVYSGALGFLALNGAADLSIVIRTAVLFDSELSVGGGGAIVLDSDPQAEFDEMLLKIGAALRGLRPAGRAPEWAGPDLAPVRP